LHPHFSACLSILYVNAACGALAI